MGKKKFKRRTAVSFICDESTQIIKLKLQNQSIDRIKKLEVIVGTSTSLILTQVVESKIDLLVDFKKSIKAESLINQYVMPKSLISKIKHAAIINNCHSYEIVEQCILNLTLDEENSIIKKLHAKFRLLGIV